MTKLLAEQDIPDQWLTVKETPDRLVYTLAPAMATTTPVNFMFDPRFELRDAKVSLPTSVRGKSRTVLTASKKEILLALLHPGRQTVAPCDVLELRDHIGVRQNIAAWTEQLEWQFPDNTAAAWNPRHWRNGTPKKEVSVALMDAFLHQKTYSIGCYTASKMAYAQGVLDYYTRVQPNQERKAQIEDCLWSNGDPLVDIEPGAMWFFESDFEPQKARTQGKLGGLIDPVAPENFVPGDWAYLLNPDPVSYAKPGYEGSNAIYLGRGRFDDYYNDRNHFYTYLEKLDEVYQWRHGVFSRSRHTDRINPLTVGEVRNLGRSPADNGLVLPYRMVPYFFGDPTFLEKCRDRSTVN